MDARDRAHERSADATGDPAVLRHVRHLAFRAGRLACENCSTGNVPGRPAVHYPSAMGDVYLCATCERDVIIDCDIDGGASEMCAMCGEEPTDIGAYCADCWGSRD